MDADVQRMGNGNDGYGKKTSLGTKGKEQGDHREVAGEGFWLRDA
jgi:hypothetical protein